MEAESNKCESHQVRVQFSDEINHGDNSNIQVNVVNQYLVNIHLGFLQVRHRYEIKFTFECPNSMEQLFDGSDSGPSVYAKITELKAIKTTKGSKSKPASTKHSVTAQLFAYKEKLLHEKVCLLCGEKKANSLTFVFHARVLGNGKGTPFLKDGIKCIGLEPDEDDDSSDFQPN